ncbi:MAG: M48 family metalloprotease [bacterium]|nr:M48 family metalloprotease [bacterium]MDQ3159060.1 M48 family metalloprotease [bacterium]
MYSEIASNKRKTVFIFFAFLIVATALGFAFSAYMGDIYLTPYVLLGATIYGIISYLFSSKMALALNGAHEIKKKDHPRLYRIVENLAITEGQPMPKVCVIDDPAMNAFATGHKPKDATVCATTGLINALNDKELEGVMAHEMAHVRNYDVRINMMAFALVAMISIMADILIRSTWFRGRDSNNNMQFVAIFAAILAPIVATLIQLAISRKREYLADASGALTTRYPEGLASALEKISKHGSKIKRQNTSTAHLFFANPLKKDNVSSLLATHPPIAERIKRLNTMGRHQ